MTLIERLRDAYSRVEDTRGNAYGPFADAVTDLRDAAYELDQRLTALERAAKQASQGEDVRHSERHIRWQVERILFGD